LFLKINKEVHCSGLQQSAHAFQVDLLLHSPGPVETRNLVPEVCCCFKVTSKQRPLMASDNFTAKFPMIFERGNIVHFESEISCNYNVQPQLLGIECLYYCIIKMEAMMQLLSSNTSHPDLTLWNLSKL